MQRVRQGLLSSIHHLGITSAHAESTKRLPLNAPIAWDHLCACREYLLNATTDVTKKGSPLRMQRVLHKRL